MLKILKDSIIWSIFVWCAECFEWLYQNSLLKCVISKAVQVFKNSYIGKIPRGYLQSKPIYFSSGFHCMLDGFSKNCRKKLSFLSESVCLSPRYEIAVYVLALYAVLDALFRKYVPLLTSVWDELFLIVLCVLCVMKWLTCKKEKALKTSPFDSCILIFIGVMLFLMLVSPRTAIAVEGFRVNVQNVFWFFLVFQLLDERKAVENVSALFVGLVGMLAVHGVYQFAVGVEMPATWIASNETGIRTRVYSIFTSPNIFGSLIVLAFPICIAFIIISKELKNKLLFSVALMFMAGSLVFTYSRGAWIGVVCAIGIYLLLKNKKLIIPAIIGGMLILVFVPSIGNRIAYMISPDYMASSMKGGRLIRWLTGFQILQEHPWFGLGLGSFGGAVASNHDLSAIVRGASVPTFYMDNFYMKIAAEAGIIGIMVFVWLMWQVFAISLKTVTIVKDKTSHELGIGILAGLLGVIVHNCVENVFEVPMMAAMFWMFVAVMAQLWYSNYDVKMDCRKRG